MSSFSKIKALLPQLSASEAKLASFVLENAQQIRTLSSIELAQAAGVSQSSVIKFSQKLGYKGFPTFKLAIVDDLNLQSLKQLNTSERLPINSNDPISDLAAQLIQHQNTVMEETLQLNQSEDFNQVIAKIKSARKILISGIGSSNLVANDFALKLQKIGLPALSQVDEISASAYLATMHKDDLFIAISTSGDSKSIVTLAEQARQNECCVVSISKYGNSALTEQADLTLSTAFEKEPVEHAGIITRTASTFVTDILFLGLTQSHSRWQKRASLANDNMRAMRHR
jgi:DNA-binding MurR/RpiR family transcriptional regulator